MLFCVFSFLLLFVINVTYVSADEEIYSGTIVCNNNVNLSNIKIAIVELNSNNQSIKDRFVLTDNDGFFIFSTKLSQFKLEIDLATLPDMYGVEQKSLFVYSEKDHNLFI